MSEEMAADSDGASDGIDRVLRPYLAADRLHRTTIVVEERILEGVDFDSRRDVFDAAVARKLTTKRSEARNRPCSLMARVSAMPTNMCHVSGLTPLHIPE